MTNSINWQAVPIAPEDTAVTIPQIMVELGIKARSTVYAWAKSGTLPPLFNHGSGSTTFCWRSHLDLYKANLKPIYIATVPASCR